MLCVKEIIYQINLDVLVRGETRGKKKNDEKNAFLFRM